MERFGKKLKEYLASNDCTVYRLSKCTGIERTGLHRAISGQRPLPEDSLFKIMDFLHLTQREREELLEAYAIDSIGEDAYRQRMLILRLIDSLAHICLPQNEDISINKQVEITSNIFTGSPLLVHGKYKIINLIQICMEHDLYESSAPPPHTYASFCRSPNRNLRSQSFRLMCQQFSLRIKTKVRAIPSLLCQVPQKSAIWFLSQDQNLAQMPSAKTWKA